MTTNNPKSFSDLVKPTCQIADLVGEVTIFESFSIAKGRYGDFAKVEVIRQNGMKNETLLTGAAVIMDRLRAAENHRMLPMGGTVILVPGQFEYYDLVAPEDFETGVKGTRTEVKPEVSKPDDN